MILSDKTIRELVSSSRLIIDPVSSDTVRENGVDLRLGGMFCRMKRVWKVLDIREGGLPEDYYECGKYDSFIVYPHEHILLHTREYVGLPNDVAGLVNLRSTFARLGLFIPATVVDAGFQGELTIEVVGGEYPVRLYPDERFIHLVLVKLDRPAEKPYKGRYQGQRGVRLPKVFETGT
ncbi:MAG: dCTP deaminase [Desulfurococcales archaeon]|nr:dCTP deaminase [Desulfurococcales archaeon]